MKPLWSIVWFKHTYVATSDGENDSSAKKKSMGDNNGVNNVINSSSKIIWNEYNRSDKAIGQIEYDSD